MIDGTIDIENYWIDVATLASLKGITERAVRLSLRQKKYISKVENTRGGKSYKIKLSSIEPELQNRFINEYYKDLVLSETSEELRIINPKQERIIPEEQKRLALAKLDLLKLWDKFRTEHKNKGTANSTFLKLYNTGELYRNIYEILGEVSIGSLYRWKSLIGSINNDDWTLLVSNYRYSGEREYRTSLCDEEIRIFMKILLNQNRFSIGKAIGLTKHILTKRGYELLPKDITFRRYAQYFKTANYDKWVLAREGQKALRDKVEPYIIRDASVLDVFSVLIADGHRLNFQVINPFTGKPTRANLVGFLV